MLDVLKYKIVVFDLDGTIYYGDKIIDGANDVIRYFREKQIKVYFVSNNSFKKREQIYKKLVDMGISCNVEEVLNSGLISSFIINKFGIKDIYVFGSDNLKEELKNNNVSISENIDDAKNLIIGYNPDFNYEKLTNAVNVALKADKIIVCNEDKIFPGKDGRLMPGCGAMVAPVLFCSNRKYDYFVGKPNPLMINMVAEKNKVDIKDILIIGDNYETDIQMAIKANCDSIYIGKEKYENTICVEKIIDVLNI